MTSDSTERMATKPKTKKKHAKPVEEDSIASVLDYSNDTTSVLLERRLFSSRKTKRLDLSIAINHANAHLPHALTPLQVFPRAIVAHEQVSGHRLRELWLTNHRLATLPPEIALFSQLHVLGLAGNALTSLPPELAQLAALESLFLERNQLRGLPESVVLPRQLRDLRLDHNHLSDVPEQITRLRLLQRLGLSHNRLTRLPVEMRRLTNLVELDVDHNEISSDGFPDDAIARLQHLARLGLDGNRLGARPPCLLRMPNVGYVRLNGNRAVVEEQHPNDQDGSTITTSGGVPRRHDGYFQCVDGYDATKPPAPPPSRPPSETHAPLQGLVPSRDQNLVNALSYQHHHRASATPRLGRRPSPGPAAVAVSASFDFRDARDRRASSAIALLERHHSSVLQPFDDDDLISEKSDERGSLSKPRFFSSAKHKLSHIIATPLDDDERRDINDTVNTSENDYSVLMAGVPRSDAPSSPRSANANASLWVRFRVLEFAISLSMMGVAGAFAIMPTHLREIPTIEVRISATQTVFARDPTLNNKKLPEQVPMSALMVGATGVPILVNLVMNFVLPKFKRVRVIPHDTRDFLLSLAQSAGISQLITHFIKNMTGRFRPSFYDMCKWDYSKVWDGVSNLCQDKKKEMEGRRSFPSGHSSYAFATLFLLTLYLMGRSRLNCENRDETVLRGGRKTLKLFLCFAPTLVAAWIAVTRSVDNWHHYADILAGSIIGVFAACFGYGYNYGSIFNWESAGVPYQEAHVRRKKRDLDFQEASLALLNSSAPRSDTEPSSRLSATYATAPAPPSTAKGDVAIHIQ